MKKVVTFSTTLLAALVLTACGSGGGKGDNSASQQTTPSVTPSSNPSNNKPTTPTTQPNVNNGTGGVAILYDYTIPKPLTTNADFKKFIVVDGKKIAIVKDYGPGVTISTKTWQIDEQGDKGTYACCGAYESVRFGAVEEGPYGSGYFYYNGIPTKDMLTTGKASYAGHFIISADDADFEDEDYYRGAAKFDVDFGTKTLSGQLTHKDFQPISVAAKLNGNSFAGSATSPQLAGKAVVEGKFYGEKAKELGGMFHNDKAEWSGAFGAAKQ